MYSKTGSRNRKKPTADVQDRLEISGKLHDQTVGMRKGLALQ